MSLTNVQLVVDPIPGRIRLEDYLFDKFPDLSRMYIRDVIRSEKCEVNGRIENKGKRVRSGDFVEIELEMDRATAMRPESIPLDILYEDADVIAVNKPSGMLVHPTHRDKKGTLLNALSFYLNQGNNTVRPGLVHRLDKDTSGIILVAKNLSAHRNLAKQFQKKTIAKTYLALIEGVPENTRGTIEKPIGRFADEKRWDVRSDGNYAVTRYRWLVTQANVSLLELEPITGRTNQLRIHCASIGHPIVGDTKRGGRAFEVLCLHAHRLRFNHPANGRIVELIGRSPEWLERRNLPRSKY